MKNFSMFFENFGLIEEADITLKPLTIFLGENNTGKSYIAQLIYALTRSVGNIKEPLVRLTHPAYQRAIQDIKYSGNTVNAFINRLPSNWEEAMKSTKEFNFEVAFEDLPPKLRNDCVDIAKIYLSRVRIHLDRELKEAYGVKRLDDLSTKLKRGNNFAISIENHEPLLRMEFGAERNHLYQRDEIRLSFEGTKIQTEISQFHKRFMMRRELSPIETIRWLISLTVMSSLDCFTDIFPRNAYYLPAARSGILQGQKLIARAGLQQLKRAGMTAMSMSKLPGVVVDFLDQIYSVDKDMKSEFGNLSREIEKRLTAGSIGIKEVKEELPEIYFYVKEMGRFPLYRTSSMVSELAPIILILRYLIGRNDIIILEEPESHLHPKLQREFARIIANFVRNGIIVLITTHSDYFVEQLGNIIALSSQMEDIKRNLGYEENDIIYENEVGAYKFSHGRYGFTVIEGLKIDKSGISDSGFGAVAEGLYEESVEVKKRK